MAAAPRGGPPRRGRDGAADDAAASLGLDPEDVRAGFDLVRQRLRPWATPPPARDPGPPQLADVVVIRTQDGELDVEVPDSDWFGLQAAAIPARLRANAVAAGWLAGHRTAALAFLAQLDTRAAVLRRVAQHTVLAQRAMFDHGPAHQADLSRSRVAAALGLHPSTVSRAVPGKTVRGPRGETFPSPTCSAAAPRPVGGSPSCSSSGHTASRRTPPRP